MSSEEFEREEGGMLPDFVRDPAGIVRRRWPWMLGVLALGLAGTAVFLASLESRYAASATILVTSQSVPEYFVRPTVQEDSLARVNAMMGQILTRAKLAELIEKHDLYLELRDRMTMDALVARVREDIKVEPERTVARTSRNESASLLRVEFEADAPGTAADMANEIASLFTAENIRSRSRQARLTTEFLRKELETAEADLREQDRLITEFKERYRGELPGELSSSLARLDRLQLQRQSLTAQIEESTNRLTILSQGGSQSPDERLLALRARLDEQLALHTERHPDVVTLRDQIERLEQEQQSSGEATATRREGPLVQAERRYLAQLRSQLAETNRLVASLDDQVARTPKRQEELTALEQKASVLRENYLAFLRKVQEAELAQNLESAQYGASFTVLDRAVPPASPVTSRLQFLAGGVGVSLLLAVGLGVLLELLDPVLVSADQVARISELPVLGSIPHIA